LINNCNIYDFFIDSEKLLLYNYIRKKLNTKKEIKHIKHEIKHLI